MKTFKFGEMASIPHGTTVKATFSNVVILGKIVGKDTAGLSQLHIIKCIDSTLPTEKYPYDTFVAPLRLITMFEDGDI